MIQCLKHKAKERPEKRRGNKVNELRPPHLEQPGQRKNLQNEKRNIASIHVLVCLVYFKSFFYAFFFKKAFCSFKEWLAPFEEIFFYLISFMENCALISAVNCRYL